MTLLDVDMEGPPEGGSSRCMVPYAENAPVPRDMTGIGHAHDQRPAVRLVRVLAAAWLWAAFPAVPVAAAVRPPAVAAAATPSAPAGPAAPAPRVAVSPGDNLHDGQVIKVHMTGFTPDLRFVVVQCAEESAPVQQADCNLGNARVDVLDHGGRADTQLTVAVGPFGHGNVSCSTQHPCIVLAQEFADQRALTSVAPIAFSAHPGDPNSLFATRTGFGIAIMVVVVVIFLLVEAETVSVVRRPASSPGSLRQAEDSSMRLPSRGGPRGDHGVAGRTPPGDDRRDGLPD